MGRGRGGALKARAGDAAAEGCWSKVSMDMLTNHNGEWELVMGTTR